MSEERQGSKVHIYGSEYAIRGEANEVYIQSLAKYVNDKMNDIAQSTHLTSPLKICILASINMADEIFRLRDQRNEKTQSNPAPVSPPAAKTNDETSLQAEIPQAIEDSVPPEAISALSQHIQSALDDE